MYLLDWPGLPPAEAPPTPAFVPDDDSDIDTIRFRQLNKSSSDNSEDVDPTRFRQLSGNMTDPTANSSREETSDKALENLQRDKWTNVPMLAAIGGGLAIGMAAMYWKKGR